MRLQDLFPSLQVRVVVSLVIVLLGGIANVSAQIAPTFFGMQMGKGSVTGQPWPVDKICNNPFQGCDGFGGMRLWDSGTAWALINYAPGQYDWSILDAWINNAKKHQIDVVYCFGRVPLWASSQPGDKKCANGGGPGQCDPPNDLNADGTGTNQHFKDFVTAIVTHAAGRIHYWETWDEAPNPMRWQGTLKQMLRMASDLRTIALSIDPNAVILSPSGGIRYANDTKWFQQYYSGGGGNYADVITYHGYVDKFGQHPDPESLITYLNQKGGLLSTLQTTGQNGKPLWDTEASWGVATCCGFTDLDLEAGFVARFYVVHQLLNTSRFYWYEWNGFAGTLWKQDPVNFTGPGSLLIPGHAYQQIYNWLVGNTLDTSCKPTGTVWACNVTGANGYQGQIVWDTSKTCHDHVCTTSQYTFNSIYIQYVDLAGNVTSTSGLQTVPIGYKPILLQNMTPKR